MPLKPVSAALLKETLNKSVSVCIKSNVLAAVFVADATGNVCLVSVGIGRKCLNENEFSPSSKKRLVVDCHAEVLARKAFVRWLLLEMKKASDYLEFNPATEKYRFNGEIFLYTTKIPCGDCSVDELLYQKTQWHDAEQIQEPLNCESESAENDKPVIRGHSQPHLKGRRRSKPGRGDAFFAPSLSCSDKIAKWLHNAAYGVESKLLAGRFEQPLRLAKVFVEHRRLQCADAIVRGLFGRFGKTPTPGFVEIVAGNNGGEAENLESEASSDAFLAYWAIFRACPGADKRFVPVEEEHLVKGMRRGASLKAAQNPKCFSKIAPFSLENLRDAL